MRKDEGGRGISCFQESFLPVACTRTWQEYGKERINLKLVIKQSESQKRPRDAQLRNVLELTLLVSDPIPCWHRAKVKTVVRESRLGSLNSLQLVQ